MPRMDGMEAVRQLRSGQSGALDEEVYVIALTANAMSGDRERFIEAGANDYLAKPVLPMQLFDAITRVIVRQLERGMELRTVAPSLLSIVTAPIAPTLSMVDEQDPLRTPRLQRLFIEDCLALLAQLNDAAVQSDHGEVARIAHSLKGSAGQFAEQGLETSAALMEQAASQSNVPAMTAAMLQLNRHRSILAARQPVVPSETGYPNNA